ncbi:hypothetical protein BASA81_000095 [Batrachochytrium salamandrivorans]|nr:hypothetical protein BASA81_000095 [Batrachochytrium salamandrivorans]
MLRGHPVQICARTGLRSRRRFLRWSNRFRLIAARHSPTPTHNPTVMSEPTAAATARAVASEERDDDLMYLVAHLPLFAVLYYSLGPLVPLLLGSFLLFFARHEHPEAARLLKTPRKSHEQIFGMSNVAALAFSPLVLSLAASFASN